MLKRVMMGELIGDMAERMGIPRIPMPEPYRRIMEDRLAKAVARKLRRNKKIMELTEGRIATP